MVYERLQTFTPNEKRQRFSLRQRKSRSGIWLKLEDKCCWMSGEEEDTVEKETGKKIV